MLSMSRRRLFAALGGLAGLALKSPQARGAQTVQPPSTHPMIRYRGVWLRPDLKIPSATRLAASNFYGLISVLTYDAKPLGALFVKGIEPMNPHQPKLHVRLSDLQPGSQPDETNVEDGSATFNLQGRRIRVVKQGTIPATANAEYAANRHIWSDPNLLVTVNNLVPGLRVRPRAQVISSAYANAYVEFAGGQIEPSVPWAAAGWVSLFTINGSNRPPISLTDNFIATMPLAAGNMVDILTRPLDQPNAAETVLATVHMSGNIVPLFFTNDVATHSVGGNTILHSRAYFQLFENPPAANVGLPTFFAGIGGENTLKGLRPFNADDPICNGSRIELGD